MFRYCTFINHQGEAVEVGEGVEKEELTSQQGLDENTKFWRSSMLIIIPGEEEEGVAP